VRRWRPEQLRAAAFLYFSRCNLRDKVGLEFGLVNFVLLVHPGRNFLLWLRACGARLTALILRVKVVWPTGGVRLASGSNGKVRLLDKRSVRLSTFEYLQV
jgi:hypothetical protein